MGRSQELKAEGTTVVITTHYMDEAEKLCDRLAIMDRGKIIAEGSPAKLIDDLLAQRGSRKPQGSSVGHFRRCLPSPGWEGDRCLTRSQVRVAITFGLAKYMLLATFRNRNSLIFGLLFPLIFVEVFGAIGGGGADQAKIGVSDALANSSAPLIVALKAMDGQKNSPIKLEFGPSADLPNQGEQRQPRSGT